MKTQNGNNGKSIKIYCMSVLSVNWQDVDIQGMRVLNGKLNGGKRTILAEGPRESCAEYVALGGAICSLKKLLDKTDTDQSGKDGALRENLQVLRLAEKIGRISKQLSFKDPFGIVEKAEKIVGSAPKKVCTVFDDATFEKVMNRIRGEDRTGNEKPTLVAAA